MNTLYLRDLLLRAVNEEQTGDDGEPAVSYITFTKSLNIKDAVFTSAKAWDEVCSKQTVARSWHKLWPVPDEVDSPAATPAEQPDQTTAGINSLLTDLGVDKSAGEE